MVRGGWHSSRSAFTAAGTPLSIRQLSSSEDPKDGVELAQSLKKILVQLTPVAPALWELMHDGYEADWFCCVGSCAVEHAVELDRDT